jgi:hypothetical protein
VVVPWSAPHIPGVQRDQLRSASPAGKRSEFGDAGRVPGQVGRDQVGEVADRGQRAVDCLAFEAHHLGGELVAAQHALEGGVAGDVDDPHRQGDGVRARLAAALDRAVAPRAHVDLNRTLHDHEVAARDQRLDQLTQTTGLATN